jgi:predicted tellurium resistance membrane protein TerC
MVCCISIDIFSLLDCKSVGQAFCLLEMFALKVLIVLTSYLLEQSLSVDNLFVFVVVFKYFRVPLGYQVNFTPTS